MGAAVPLRTDFSAGELRQLAKRAEDVDQARRLLSLAAVLDGQNRKVAAEIGAMDRQTLRDWVHRFIPSTSRASRLTRANTLFKPRAQSVRSRRGTPLQRT